MEDRFNFLKQRYLSLKEEIENACSKTGRNLSEVQLIAVSKKHPAQDIAYLYQLGHTVFGENYVQEALDKQKQLNDLNLNWHFIGSLQTNKVKFVVGNFTVIHTVDREKLVSSLAKQCQKKNYCQKILIQVNVGREPQKAGVLPEGLEKLTEIVLDQKGLKLEGLMTLPPYTENKHQIRKYFSFLRELKEKLEQKFSIQLKELSMGMTHDFKEAIMEGATMIRIGTKIFGPRE
ncbi:MAG: YggS family pyridoxal phosphate-dependent enzyme [Desulfonauticus sp.]|nr:YggS family pyridoxal phosphate-dependent enzyme [Desulfonauticus sp.]